MTDTTTLTVLSPQDILKLLVEHGPEVDVQVNEYVFYLRKGENAEWQPMGRVDDLEATRRAVNAYFNGVGTKTNEFLVNEDASVEDVAEAVKQIKLVAIPKELIPLGMPVQAITQMAKLVAKGLPAPLALGVVASIATVDEGDCNCSKCIAYRVTAMAGCASPECSGCASRWTALKNALEDIGPTAGEACTRGEGKTPDEYDHTFIQQRPLGEQ